MPGLSPHACWHYPPGQLAPHEVCDQFPVILTLRAQFSVVISSGMIRLPRDNMGQSQRLHPLCKIGELMSKALMVYHCINTQQSHERLQDDWSLTIQTKPRGADVRLEPVEHSTWNWMFLMSVKLATATEMIFSVGHRFGRKFVPGYILTPQAQKWSPFDLDQLFQGQIQGQRTGNTWAT